MGFREAAIEAARLAEEGEKMEGHPAGQRALREVLDKYESAAREAAMKWAHTVGADLSDLQITALIIAPFDRYLDLSWRAEDYSFRGTYGPVDPGSNSQNLQVWMHYGGGEAPANTKAEIGRIFTGKAWISRPDTR